MTDSPRRTPEGVGYGSHAGFADDAGLTITQTTDN